MGHTSFCGAKIALLCGDDLLVYLRDDKPGLKYANQWDLPGGGREGAESPEACALRELQEEFGITLPESRITHAQNYICGCHGNREGWLFAGAITAAEIAAIQFGDEGQYWRLMPLAEYMASPDAIAPLVKQLQRWIDGTGDVRTLDI